MFEGQHRKEARETVKVLSERNISLRGIRAQRGRSISKEETTEEEWSQSNASNWQKGTDAQGVDRLGRETGR